ncbi:MAG: isoprenylcysteine carboxylmethyltransferase family protein [Pseudomonadota bacterium]|nr:isoprenylcysteine carboxylmethyltransferase family protein [Pseudomonadota bacterium]
MLRSLAMAFALVAYAVFFATFLYLIGFLADAPFLPHTVDGGPAASSTAALIIDLALVALFGVQHSVMARQGFNRAWTRLIPEPIERSVYVLFASAALILLFAFWHPIGGSIWSVTNPLGAGLLWVFFAMGWLIVLSSTFLLNHFELFGLQQAWFNLRQRAAAPPQFRTPLYYRFVRHPLYSGFFLAFWAIPTMSAGHLLFATAMSTYMLIAIQFEERDLVGHFGDEYETYRSKVGMLAPGLGKRRSTAA